MDADWSSNIGAPAQAMLLHRCVPSYFRLLCLRDCPFFNLFSWTDNPRVGISWRLVVGALAKATLLLRAPATLNGMGMTADPMYEG